MLSATCTVVFELAIKVQVSFPVGFYKWGYYHYCAARKEILSLMCNMMKCIIANYNHFKSLFKKV